MRCFLFLIVLCSLAACGGAGPDRDDHVMPQPGDASSLQIKEEKASGDREIAFSVRRGAEIYTDYGLSHTKEMHLIIVRNDLSQFRHLHPERDGSGTWRVAFTPPLPGRYWFYADFADSEGKVYVLRFEKVYPGNTTKPPLVKDPAIEKTIDGLTFTFQPTGEGVEAQLTFLLTDSAGKTVETEEYLGAKGHSILLTEGGGYLHTHPKEGRGPPTFSVVIERGTFFRVFTQFKIAGKVRTIAFDWEP